ncbi:hypothetical protein OH77DRAFT_1399986, partial [Trametes cingulata]
HLAADTDQLARDLWPDGLGQMIQEKELALSTLPEMRKVPLNAEDLADWVVVERQPGSSRALVYVRGDEATASEADEELIVRLQGVIMDMNLTLGGNWDGTESRAMKASQYIMLGHGGCTAPFEPQACALRNITDAVLAHLGCCFEEGRAKGSSVVLRRQVFTKIRHGFNDDAPSLVAKSEDTRGKYRAIQNSWRVTEKVRVGTQLAHGEIFPLPPLSLRKGDFVDVSVRVGITWMRAQKARRWEVSFEPLTVVRLATASKFKVSAVDPGKDSISSSDAASSSTTIEYWRYKPSARYPRRKA